MRSTLARLIVHKSITTLPSLTSAALRSSGAYAAANMSNIRRIFTAKLSVSCANLLITRLSRQGRISDARHLFDLTSQRDIITWTALIAAYARAGRLCEAHLLFFRSDALRDVFTWTALLSGYARAGRVQDAEDLFYRMPEKNVVSWNAMVFAYADNGMVDKALELFHKMPVRNIVSWNTMITALAQSGRIQEACNLFFQMTERNVVSWTAIVSGLSQNGRVDVARELFDRMPERNVVSWNAMVSGYSQNHRIYEALLLFEAMPERNFTSWNTMITGFIQNQDLKTARKFFDKMRLRNVVSWTTLIAGYTYEGHNELALKTFLEMLVDGIKPNECTYVTVLAAISSIAAHLEGLQVHQIISKTKFQFSPFVESTLISMYSKCGDIGMAQKVFDLSNQLDLVNWNGMIAAYAHHGYGKKAIHLFEDMQSRGLKPNDVTYIGLLTACSHTGLVDEGLKLFDSLVMNGSIEVRDDHYACLADLCSRAGRLEEVGKLIARLSTDGSSGFALGSLLSGCNFHGNVNLGKLAAKQLFQADSCNAVVYLLMSSMYASNGRWKEAAEIRSRMTDKGLKKQPGCSWIELGNRVHVFVARDKLHNQFNAIDSILQELHHEMKIVVL